MATVNVNVDLSTIAIGDLLTYTNVTYSPTSVKLYDDSQNYVELKGFGITPVIVGGNIVDVTGGTLTDITFVEGGVTLISVTGASASAADLFDLAVAHDTTGALQLFLAGDDSITGSGANDTLFGFDGNDSIFGLGGADWLHGNGGRDLLVGAGGNDRLWGDSGNDVLKGGSGLDTLLGGLGRDKLFGQVGNDVLRGDGGADKLYGAGGGDTLKGEAGSDVLQGGNGFDKLIGGSGNDKLVGGGGQDTLLGGLGQDTLTGGAGADTLRGSAGDDTFNFNRLADSGPGFARDKIADFVQGHDLIDVHTIDADSTTPGNQDFNFIGTSHFSAAGDLRYVTSGGHTIIAGDVNGDGTPDFRIELLTVVTLVDSDFHL